MAHSSLTKQERIVNGIKTDSSASGAGKTGQQKNEPGPLSYTTHKNKLKMDKKPKCKKGSHQNPRGESRKKPLWPWPQQLLTQYVSGGKGNKNKNELQDLIKIKSFCTVKETTKLKGNQQNGRIYLQMTYPIKRYYPKSIKHFSNSTPKKQIIQWRNGQKTWIDTSPKKTSRWPTNTWKNAQLHSSPGKYKSKP